jgi:hypothetical protein
MGKTLTDLADVCRSTGYPVVEVESWQERGRGGAGGDKTGGYEADAPNHIIVHHTASGPDSDGWPDVNYMVYGHQDAPCGNLYLSRDGTVYVMAGRAANTNGSGQDPCGIVADDNMNAKSIAIEAGNNGVGEPWPGPQQDSYVKLCAALGAAYGIGEGQVHSHFEWAPGRKIDPAGESNYAVGGDMWDMNRFRGDVGGGVVPPQPQPEPPQPQPEPPPAGWVCPPFPGVGDYGCSYDTCRAWQDAMILNGYIKDNTANHDGVWGDGMHNACKKMQQSWGWGDADGIGGQHTWPHLRSRKVAPCPKCGK